MKNSEALVFYVRRHSITPIALLGNRVVPLEGERLNPIWLYFFEDTANARIDYGLSYRKPYEEGALAYLGDVLTRLWDEDCCYTYGFTRRHLRSIFEDAGIWQSLREAYRVSTGTRTSDNPISLYVCFHPELDAVHRIQFVQLLREIPFFRLKAYGLSLESCAWMNWRAEDKELHGDYVLSVQAMSSDLCISAISDEAPTDLIAGHVFEKRGTDPRRRALLNRVVRQINKANRFLHDEASILAEMDRLGHLWADEWIARLASTSNPGVPIRLDGISFACALNNVCSTTIKPIEVDADISREIESLVQGISSEASRLLPLGHHYSHLLLFGDACQSTTLRKLLIDKLRLAPDAVRLYGESDLSVALRAYPMVKEESIHLQEESSSLQARAQLAELISAKEARIKGSLEERERLSEDERKRLHREYQSAYEMGCELMGRGEYEQASEYFEIALDKQPQAQEAKEKLDEIKRVLLQEEEKSRRYNMLIQKAEGLEQAGDLTSALECYRLAELDASNTDYTSERIAEIKKILDQDRKAQQYIDRARIFIESKAYSAAQLEMHKAQLAIPSGHKSRAEINELSSLVEHKLSEQSAREHKIDSMRKLYARQKLEKQYEQALDSLNVLVDLDDRNIEHWLAEQLLIRTEVDKLQAQRREIEAKIEQAQEHLFADRLEQVIALCQEILLVEQNERALKYLRLAQDKLSSQHALEERRRQEQEQQLAYVEIVNLISERALSLAEDKIRSYEQLYPEAGRTVKELRKRLFFASEQASPKSPKQQRDFFDSPSARSESKQTRSTDFFGSDLGKKTEKEPPKKKSDRKIVDNFF